MRSLRAREFVATTARNAPARSSISKGRRSSSIFPVCAHSLTAGVASIATTRIWAPVSSKPAIFGSPTLPAPTTRHCFPSSFRNIGNKLVTGSSCRLRQILRGWQIADGCRHNFSGQKFPQFAIGVPREKAAQVLARFAPLLKLPEQTLERIRHVSGGAAISHWPRGRLMQAKRPTDAEVVSVDELTIDFEFLAF